MYSSPVNDDTEKYMAESYSERVFIELIQNADDCGSSKVLIYQHGNDQYFAKNTIIHGM